MIIFLYKVDRTRYGKYIKQLENDMLKKKKDPFPKTVADVSYILSGWQNVYGNNPRFTEANDGVAFTTAGAMDEDTKKNNNKKHITFFKWKETWHYSNECPNANDDQPTKNKIGTNFLVHNKDHDSSEEEMELTISHEHLVAIQKVNEEEESSDKDADNDIAKDTQDDDSENYEEYEGFAFIQGDILCSMQDKPGISSSWILLDS